MKIIFEDSSESPISKLLLGSSVGKDMIFCSGSRRIPRVIKQVLRTDELVVLYVDVSPNNESTVETYRHEFHLYETLISAIDSEEADIERLNNLAKRYGVYDKMYRQLELALQAEREDAE